jgi:hypothetical protein
MSGGLSKNLKEVYMGRNKDQVTKKQDMGIPEEESKKDIVTIESGEVVTYEQGNILDVFGKEDVEAFSKKLEIASEKAKKIRRYAISMTNERDWVDQNGKPYLTSSGGEVIRRTFAIDIIVDKIEKEDFEAQRCYVYTVHGRACKNGICQSEIGTRSSKDKFFAAYTTWANGKKVTKFKEMTEVDITDIKKAAVTNFEIRAISKFTGLRNVSFDELEEAGLKTNLISKIPYKKNGEKSPKKKSNKPQTKKGNGKLKARGSYLAEIWAILEAHFPDQKEEKLNEVFNEEDWDNIKTQTKKFQAAVLVRGLTELKEQAFEQAFEEEEDEDLPFEEDGSPKEEN